MTGNRYTPEVLVELFDLGGVAITEASAGQHSGELARLAQLNARLADLHLEALTIIGDPWEGSETSAG